ncbi:MAG: carbohydrate ABC transporter permease [Egibacteraceae bacterium]
MTVANFSGAVQFQVPIGSVTAASVVTTIPMILAALIFQRQIVSGLDCWGRKGRASRPAGQAVEVAVRGP